MSSTLHVLSAKMPTTDLKPPRRGVRLKTISSGLTVGRQNATATNKNRTLTPKAPSKRPALQQTSGNIGEPITPTSNGILKLKQEAADPIRRATTTVKVPVQIRKAQRNRRGTILSETPETSIFSPVQSTAPEKQYDASSEGSSDSSVFLTSRYSIHSKPPVCKLVPKHLKEEVKPDLQRPELASTQLPPIVPIRGTPLGKSLAIGCGSEYSILGQGSPPNRVPTRSALSLPSRRIGEKSKVEHTNKTVRWDPAIIVAGPLVAPEAEKWHIEERSEPHDEPSKCQPAVDVCAYIAVEELVATLKDWKKNKRDELVVLMKALREIESSNSPEELEEHQQEQARQRHTHVGHEENPSTVRKVHRLNPQVPEFRSSVNTDSYICPVPPQIRIPLSPKNCIEAQRLTPHMSSQFRPPLAPLKIPFQEARKHQMTLEVGKLENADHLPIDIPVTLQAKGIGRRMLVLDNPNECGRTVNAFDEWYADRQLKEFMKKYPLTGRHRDEVAAEVAAEKKKVEGNVITVSEALAAHFQKQNVCGKNLAQGGRFYGPQLNNHKFLDSCRRGGIRGNTVLAVGPPSVRGVTAAGRHAAVIQQRLEYLLLREKEKKAMNKIVGLR